MPSREEPLLLDEVAQLLRSLEPLLRRSGSELLRSGPDLLPRSRRPDLLRSGQHLLPERRSQLLRSRGALLHDPGSLRSVLLRSVCRLELLPLPGLLPPPAQRLLHVGSEVLPARRSELLRSGCSQLLRSGLRTLIS